MGGPRTLWLLGTRGRQIGGAGAFVTETRRRSVAEDILTRCCCWCWTVKLLLLAACMPVEGRYSCCCTARPPNYQHKFAWLMGTPDEQRRGATAAAATTYTNNNNHRSSPRKTNPGLIFFAAPQNSTTRLIPDAPYFTAKTMAHILMLYG